MMILFIMEGKKGLMWKSNKKPELAKHLLTPMYIYLHEL